MTPQPRSAAIPGTTPAVPYRSLRLALAGAMAGMLTNCLLHPLDTIKTLRQTQPKVYRGIAPAFRTIVKNQGPLALYAGIAPALIGSALSSSLYFGVYELMKLQFQRLWPAGFSTAESRMPLTAVAASCGNVASSILFVPKEVVKQRMQVGLEKGRFFAAAAAVVKSGGLTGLYRGYKATLLRNIPSTMIRFALYEELKMIFMPVYGDGKLRKWQYVTAGAISGSIASTCTMPMDVIKTRLATGKIQKGTGIWRALTEVVKREGFLGLYTGIRPRVMWSALFAAIGFSSYEICKSWVLRTKAGAKHGKTAQKHKVDNNRLITVMPKLQSSLRWRGRISSVCARRIQFSNNCERSFRCI